MLGKCVFNCEFYSDMQTLNNRLLEWQKCEISEKIELLEGGYGMGMFATKDIEEGENVLTIQPEDLITVEMAFKVIKRIS